VTQADTRIATDRPARTDAALLRRLALEARADSGRRGPARIAVIGEFNSGKTAFVNALIGTPVLPTSITAHTPCITVVAYAKKPLLSAEMPSGKRMQLALEHLEHPPGGDTRRLHVGVPVRTLAGLRVLDTPGLGLGDETAEARTLRCCRGADLVIWCTPAFQAWKYSEATLWLALPASVRAHGVLAVTFTGDIPSDDAARRLMTRLRADAGEHFRDIVLMAGSSASMLPRPAI
jgi:GTPase Era involved in 16S rRNA processing